MSRDVAPATSDGVGLRALGMAGGICEGGRCDADSQVEAGQPLFGQYGAHDITADRSPLRAHADINVLRNVRSPRANLEGLYGGGPGGPPYPFHQGESPKTLTRGNADLPRNPHGTASPSDPRHHEPPSTTSLQLC